MKKSEMIEEIVRLLPDISNVNTSPEILAESILDTILSKGMLPPVNTCRIVPDKVRGGHKHSPTAREWDNEDTVSQD